MQKAAAKKEEKTVVRLRLTPDEIATLTHEGKKHGRKLATEIAYQLRGGDPSLAPSLFAGWPAAEAETFEKFGETAARLLAGVTSIAGSQTSLQDRLGFMRAVLPVLLDGLGASLPKGDQESYFEKWTREAISGDRWAGAANALGVQHVETDLARIVRELKAK